MRPLRVAAVPSAHPYVEAIVPDVAAPASPEPSPDRSAAAVVRLPDPTPPGEVPGNGVWWPPVVVDPAWVRAHAPGTPGGVDVVHTHFGLESFSPDRLAAFVDALDEVGLPLVHTVHDLENPHLADQGPHLAGMDVVVPRATALLTLTDAVADAVEARWGRRPVVVPHPRIVPERWFAEADRVRSSSAGGVVGMHLGAVRASTDPRPWLAALADAVAARAHTLVVRVGDGAAAATGGHAHDVVEHVRALADDGRLVLDAGPRLDDDALHRWVSGLDVAVLPYRAGTHSGWLEMCWDLGTSVLVPDVGAIAGQHDDPSFRQVFRRAEPDGIGPALDALLGARAASAIGGTAVPWGDGDRRRQVRAAQLDDVRRTHARVYAEAVARAGASRGGRRTPCVPDPGELHVNRG